MGSSDYIVRKVAGYWTLQGPVNEEGEFHGLCKCTYEDGTGDIFIGMYHNGWISGPGKYYIGVLNQWVKGNFSHYSSYQSYWAIDLDQGSDLDKRAWCAYMISKEEGIPITITDHYREELANLQTVS